LGGTGRAAVWAKIPIGKERAVTAPTQKMERFRNFGHAS
jgi:hypothetical protein